MRSSLLAAEESKKQDRLIKARRVSDRERQQKCRANRLKLQTTLGLRDVSGKLLKAAAVTYSRVASPTMMAIELSANLTKQNLPITTPTVKLIPTSPRLMTPFPVLGLGQASTRHQTSKSLKGFLVECLILMIRAFSSTFNARYDLYAFFFFDKIQFLS